MSERAIEEYRIAEEPYYLPVDNEIGLFESAHAAHLPVILKGPKQSTRQRFIAIDCDYPPADLEAAVVAREGGIDEGTARDLVLIGQKVRNLRGHGLEEGVSTRLLIYAAQLISNGIAPTRAAEVAMCSPITDDRDLQRSIREIITTVI